MQKILLILSIILLASCQKDVHRKQVVKEATVNASVTAGTDYILSLSDYGDEGDVAKITEQPLYAATSKMENETDMFTTVYHYASNPSAAGKTEKITITINHYDGDSSMIYLNLALK